MSQNFLSKLKRHILPRVLGAVGLADSLEAQSCDPSTAVLFRYDRLYQHNILRVNYTSYDVRRSQDTINARTSHCNVMTLAENVDGASISATTTSSRPYLYARVLGTYHANVFYNGPKKANYQQSHRIDFLWVRWYEQLGSKRCAWSSRKLDCLRFLPVTDDHAFGFIDPSDVLRASHIVPTFSKGQLYQGLGTKGISACAQDSHDWREYNVNWYVKFQYNVTVTADHPAYSFVDRDMMMRFHFGLAVGHVYAHPRATPSAPDDDTQDNEDLDLEDENSDLEDLEKYSDNGSDIDDDDLESEDSDPGLAGIPEVVDDLEFEEFDDMYGPNNYSI